MKSVQRQIEWAAQQFVSGPLLAYHELSGGNINQTWRLTPAKGDDFILQRLNPSVFSQPEQSCRNMARLAQAHSPWPQAKELGQRWQIPRLLPTRTGEYWCYGEDAALWRAMTNIGESITLDRVTSGVQAASLGWALALFHRLAATIPLAELPATITHFHDIDFYFGQLKQAIVTAPLAREVELLDFVKPRQATALELALALEQGDLELSVSHGDPKLANFLFAEDGDQAKAIIDLDTIGPGLLLHDLGDCLRSCAASHSEEAGPGAAISLDLTTCRHFLISYQQTAPELLSAADLHHLPRAIWLLPFELGVRFLTDHFRGNSYFKTSHPNHNLERAALQFALVRNIEEQEDDLAVLCRQLRP